MTSLLSLSEEILVGEQKTVIKSPKIVSRYGKQGDKQYGIDILAEIDGGNRIAIQCKYHEPMSKVGRVTLDEAKKSVAKAEKEYPKAHHYILATNIERNHPNAIEFIAKRENWTFWGKQDLHLIIRQLPLAKAWPLVIDHFGASVAREFFPLGPAMFLSPSEYRKLGKGTLSHRYPCVGRNTELSTIKKSLLKKKAQAVIIPGEGGIGKSRLFLEALSQIKDENPSIEVLIAEPDNDGKWAQLNLQPNAHLIIGLDDCHLQDRLSNKLLILARQRPNTSLLLMTRPGGVDGVKVKLRISGWEDSISQPLKEKPLSCLKPSAMKQLAQEIVGKNHEDLPEIVRRSDGNALFVVIACEKLRKKGWRINRTLNETQFHEEIYDTLSDQITHDRENKNRALHTASALAILSPFKNCDSPKIAKLLEIDEYELDEEIHRLRHRGLLRLGSDTSRIIPDLFSDHLVKSIFASSPSSPLLRRLKESPLFHHQNISVFKNLALLQWYQDQEKSQPSSLIEPLWKKFQTDYESKDDFERHLMLESWKSFGLYLPNETLTLCRQALDTEPRHPDDLYFDCSETKVFYAKQIQDEVVVILKALAEYNLNKQAQALEILWDLLIKQNESLQLNYKEVFSEILSYEGARFPSSLEAALTWTIKKLQEPENWSRVTERKTHLVETLLGQLFEPSLEKMDWEANSMQLWQVPIHFENTEPLRESAFFLIEKIALSSSLGARNCLNLLLNIASPPSKLTGGNSHSKTFESKWLTVRLQAISILEKIAENETNTVLLFLLRKAMQDLLRHSSHEEIKDAGKKVLALIDTPTDLQRLIILLSDEYTEFSKWDDDIEENQQADKSAKKWKDLSNKVARELTNQFPGATQLSRWCQKITDSFIPFDLKPNFYDLFQALHHTNPEVIEALRKHILTNDQCAFEASYAQFAFWLQADSSLQDSHLSEGIRLDRPLAFSSILNALQYQNSSKPFTKTKRTIRSLVENLNPDELEEFFKLIHSVRTKELTHLIYLNLPWQNMEKEHFVWLGKRYDIYRGIHLFKDFPTDAFIPMFKRLNQLSNDTIQDVKDLVIHGCQVAPCPAFDFFDHRVQAAEETDQSNYVFPATLGQFSLGDLSDLPQLTERIEAIYQQSILSSEQTNLWNDWLTITLSHQGDLEERLLSRRIEDLTETEQVISFIKRQLKPQHIFAFPRAIENILKKARGYSSPQSKEITNHIFYRIANHGQSYTNGEPQSSWHLDQARALSEKYRNNEILYPFYDRIVKHEQADAESHRREYLSQQNEYDQFH